MSRILLTGGRAPYTLHLARLLAQWGHVVDVAESLPENLTSRSTITRQTFVMPPPAQEPDAYVQALESAMMEAGTDVLIPTCEEVFYIARAYERLQALATIFTSPLPVLQQLHSKWEFIQLVKKLGWVVPETEILSEKQALQARWPELGRFVLKPEYSRFSTATYMQPADAPTLDALEISPQRRWVWQQTIRGPAFCSYGVAWQGQLKAHCIYPSIYCAGRGATVYFESVRIPPIEQQVRGLVKELNYTGQLALDWIQDERDGQYYPLECNPRGTNGLLLFGLSDPLAAVFTCPDQIQELYPGSQNPQMLTLALGIYVWPHIRQWQAGWQLLQKMAKAQDAVWRWQDPKPFFTQFQTLGHLWQKSRESGLSLMAASTQDIEWNGPDS